MLADLETIRIVDGQDEVVANHRRSWDRGQQLEVPEHLERLAAEKKRSREHRGLDRLTKAVPNSQAFLRCLADRGQNLGSNTHRLLQLLDAEGADALAEALVEVLERDTIHIGAVRQVLDRRRSERGQPPPISIPLAPSEHRDLVITPHSLSTYDSIKMRIPLHSISRSGRIRSGFRGSDQENGAKRRVRVWSDGGLGLGLGFQTFLAAHG